MVLTSGTVIAQLVSYVAVPFITRLYSPDEIGQLGVFLRITALITAVASARYELSLPLPKKDAHAFQLFRLSLRISAITLLVCLGLGFIYWAYKDFEVYWLVVIVTLLLSSFFLAFKNIGTNWAVRTKKFRLISLSGMFGSLTTNSLKIGAGLFGYGVVGLFISTLIGAVVGALFFIRNYFQKARLNSNKRSRPKMKVLSKNYRDLPFVSLPQMLIDHGRELLIAFFIVFFFDQTIFGSYDHSFRMLKLPLVLIGMSMGQVFLNRISTMYANEQAIFPTLKKLTITLFFISIIPFAVIFMFGGEIFAFVFGEEWYFSGKIASIISPWLMLNFVASPISVIPMVIEKLKTFFWIGLIGTLLQLIGFGLLPFFFAKEEQGLTFILWTVTIALSVYTILYIYSILYFTKKSDVSIQNLS